MNAISRLKTDIQNNKIKHICLLVGGGIGNIITFTPVIKKLNKELPYAKITLVITNKEITKKLFENYKGNIDMLELSQKTSLCQTYRFLKTMRQKKIDLLLFCMLPLKSKRALKSNIPSSLFFFLSNAKYIVGNIDSPVSFLYNIPIKPEGKNATEQTLFILKQLGFNITKEEQKPELFFNFYLSDKNIKIILNQKGLLPKNSLFFVFHTGVGKGYTSRQWQKDRWAKLGDLLIDKYRASVLFIGDKNDFEEIGKIQSLMKNKTYNFAGELSLDETASLIKISDLMICTNSGPMHIGAALGILSVVLTGPSLKEWWPTYNNNAYIIYKNTCKMFCEGYCNLNKNICMESITVEDVLDAVDKHLLKGESKWQNNKK